MIVEAQRFILEAWIVLSLTLVGLGLLVRRILALPLRGAGDLWRDLWVGWALLLSILQVWHLFLPIDDRARALVVVLGSAGWLVSALAPWRALVHATWRNLAAVIAIAACAVWLSNQSLGGPRFGDTGMYLIPTVHWYESFPSVRGIANLFVPYGHNLSYFLWAALVDYGPFAKRLYHIVNSVLALAIFARGIVGVWRLLAARAPAETAADLFYVLALVPAATLALSLWLTSPAPESAITLFGIALAGSLVEYVSDPAPSRAGLVRIAFLSAAALTIKLSIAGMALASSAIALLWWIARQRPSIGAAAGTVAACLGVAVVPLVPWMLRNISTSGLPFYPAPIAPMPVEWIARVDAVAWIQKPMNMAPLTTIFSDWPWWKTRLDSLGWTGGDAVHPGVMIAAGIATFALLRPVRWWRGERGIPLAIVLAPIAGFVFCFVNTPMPKYQGATIWLIGIFLIVVAASGLGGAAGYLTRAFAVLAALAACTVPVYLDGAPAWLAIKDFETTSGPKIHPETLPSGLVVNVPEHQTCWYAPLPCTPEPHPGLRLRVPGDLGAGFVIDEAAARPPDPAAAAAPEGG